MRLSSTNRMAVLTSVAKKIQVLILILASSTYMQAQGSPAWGVENLLSNACSPCQNPAQHWDAIPPMTTSGIVIDGCEFQVTYKRRICQPGGCQELKIEKITPVYPIPCYAVPYWFVPALVTGKFVMTNMMGFFPNTETGGNGCWRIIRPRCWRRLPAGGPDPCLPFDVAPMNVAGTFVPCDDDECCVHTLLPSVSICDPHYYFYQPDLMTTTGELNPHIPGQRHYALPGGADPDDVANANDSYSAQSTGKECSNCAPPPVPPAPGVSICIFDCAEKFVDGYTKALADFRRYKATQY